MKNKIYREDFENFLKENANDFLMVPSRKVWYSLYNNMHPDRKWPSVAVCLLILSGVLYIGISDNYSLSNAARRSAEANLSGLATNYTNGKLSVFFVPSSPTSKSTTHIFSLTDHGSAGNITGPGSGNTLSNNITGNGAEAPINSSSVTEDNTLIETNNLLINAVSPDQHIRRTGFGNIENKNTAAAPDLNISADTGSLSDKSDGKSDDTDSKVAVKKITEVVIPSLNVGSADIDKPWREDFAFKNKPAINKFKQNSGFSYYITPSFGYRDFFKTADKSITTGSEKLNDGVALNLEAGAALLYNISSHLRLKGGLQFNYTNYVSRVTELIHPTQTTLAVVDESMASRSSVYAVKSGVSRLNKTTFQVAMPLGADLRLAGVNKIKWYFGGTIQPTYVISGSAYVLSGDGKNYISETPLLRKWNMNAAVETFVSFKPGAGITLNLGPQFRYQLMSTYKKEYNYTEKLYNIGVKIGINKGL